MQLSGELVEKFPNLSKSHFVLGHATGTDSLATAADMMGAVLAARALKQSDHLDEILASAKDLYFDTAAGVYLASPAKLILGIAARAPTSGETPSAEVLALLAGVDQKTADLIRRTLFAGIEYDDLPPGDVLLGLSQTR